MPQSHKACERGGGGEGQRETYKKTGEGKIKKETDEVTASEGEGELGKEGVASSSPGIKSQRTFPDL